MGMNVDVVHVLVVGIGEDGGEDGGIVVRNVTAVKENDGSGGHVVVDDEDGEGREGMWRGNGE